MGHHYPDPPPFGQHEQTPANYPPQGFTPPDPGAGSRRRSKPLLLGLVGFVLLTLIGAGVVAIARLGSPDEPVTTAGSSATTEPPPSSPSEPSAASAPPSPTSPPQSPAAPPPAPRLPANTEPCSGSPGVAIRSGSVTSCAFAANVRRAYLRAGAMGGSRIVSAWAPQDRASVSMRCTAQNGGLVVCRGGTESVVYLY